jgi:hypothetical protein
VGEDGGTVVFTFGGGTDIPGTLNGESVYASRVFDRQEPTTLEMSGTVRIDRTARTVTGSGTWTESAPNVYVCSGTWSTD